MELLLLGQDAEAQIRPDVTVPVVFNDLFIQYIPRNHDKPGQILKIGEYHPRLQKHIHHGLAQFLLLVRKRRKRRVIFRQGQKIDVRHPVLLRAVMDRSLQICEHRVLRRTALQKILRAFDRKIGPDHIFARLLPRCIELKHMIHPLRPACKQHLRHQALLQIIRLHALLNPLDQHGIHLLHSPVKVLA